jgi:2-amino-4-hydroxy-6-hydroxymethyldihydropteridine diphosphokinase
MGRRHTRDKGPRTIDIDILLFGDRVIDEPGLKVPHPAMHERRFVLEPLVEIAAEAFHPVWKKTAQELLRALPAGQEVRRVE